MAEPLIEEPLLDEPLKARIWLAEEPDDDLPCDMIRDEPPDEMLRDDELPDELLDRNDELLDWPLLPDWPLLFDWLELLREPPLFLSAADKSPIASDVASRPDNKIRSQVCLLVVMIRFASRAMPTPSSSVADARIVLQVPQSRCWLVDLPVARPSRQRHESKARFQGWRLPGERAKSCQIRGLARLGD
jgi:hypothetical protein